LLIHPPEPALLHSRTKLFDAHEKPRYATAEKGTRWPDMFVCTPFFTPSQYPERLCHVAARGHRLGRR
jgi:hypothetical protein